jgi:hypothetical protein
MMKDAGRNSAETVSKQCRNSVKTAPSALLFILQFSVFPKVSQIAKTVLKQCRNNAVTFSLFNRPVCQLAKESPPKNGLPPFGGYDSSHHPSFPHIFIFPILFYFHPLHYLVRSLIHFFGDSQP